MDKPRETEVTKTADRPSKRVIRLEDIDGEEEEIIGGAGQKLFFGEQPESTSPFAGLFNGAGKNTPPQGQGK